MDVFSFSPRFGRLAALTESAAKHLENLGYKRGTIGNYRFAWKEFLQFAHDNSEEVFSTDLVRQFLESCGISIGTDNVESELTFRQRHIRTVMHALTEFALHGCFQRRSRVAEKTMLSADMKEVLLGYEQFCREYLGSPFGTVRSRKRDVVKFLHYLDSCGIKAVEEIRATTLSSFVISCAHLKPTTVARLLSSIRSFLRYLCMKGFTHSNLVEQVPRTRVRRDGRIPSVWKSEDVDALLAAVDRSSPCGKRDYALLLLAAKLGMRVSDIRSLRLENLMWEQGQIEINQAKGGEPLVLPLTEEIGYALIDYLRYGRPTSQFREVFLRANAPFEPLGRDNNLHYVITQYRRRAAIRLPAQNRRGLHSLRHTMGEPPLRGGHPVRDDLRHHGTPICGDNANLHKG